MRWLTGRRRLPVVLGAVCVVLLGVVAVVALGQDDDPEPAADDGDDLAADVLGDEVLELLHQAEPDPGCASEPEAPPDDEELVALDVMWLDGTCLMTRTEYVAEGDVAARRRELAEDPAVVVAGVSPPVFLDGPSETERRAQGDDDRRDDQWGLDVLEPEDAPDPAWPGGRGAVVAVLDTGVHAPHGDLGDAVIGRRHFRGEAELDPDGHGTHVAGIIAARRGNGGIVGVAPEVSVLDVPVELRRQDRILNRGADAWTGLVWAVNSGATVANLSFSGSRESYEAGGALEVVVAAVEFARHNRVVVVAAAGNCGPDPEGFPDEAKGDNGLVFGCDEANQRRVPAMLGDLVVAVGAVLEDDDDLRLAGYSPRNQDIDLVAPGHENVSTYPPGLGGDEDEVGSETRAYQTMGATSQATPHVAGAVAVAQSVYPTATRDQVVQALLGSADPDRLPEGERSDPGAGRGLLDVVGLVDGLRTAVTPDPDEVAGRTQAAFVREEVLYAFDGTRAHPVRPVDPGAPVTWLEWSDDHERLVGLSGTTLFSWSGPGTAPVETPYEYPCEACEPGLAYLDDIAQPVGEGTGDLVVGMDYDATLDQYGLTQYDARTLQELGTTTLSFPGGVRGRDLVGEAGGRLLVHEVGGTGTSERLWLVDSASGEAQVSHQVTGYLQSRVAVNAADDTVAFVAGPSQCSDGNHIHVLDGDDLTEIAAPATPPGTMVDELFFNGDTLYATMAHLPAGDPGPCPEEPGGTAGLWRLAGERWEQVRSDALANARPLEGRAGDEPTGWLVVELDGNGSIRPSSSADISLGDLGGMDRRIWSTPTRDEVDLHVPPGGGGGSGGGGSAPKEPQAPELPDAMVGPWEGSVTQESSGTTYTVAMTLFRRDADDHVGSVRYPTLGCEGYYTLASVDEDRVTLVEHITTGRDECLDGIEIVLTSLDTDRLSYRFEYAGNPQDGQGTLTRSG